MKSLKCLLPILAFAGLLSCFAPESKAQLAYHVSEIQAPPGTYEIVPKAINSSGVVVGYYSSQVGGLHAFRWTPSKPNGKTGTLEDLHPDIFGTSTANSINDNGEIVGVIYPNSDEPRLKNTSMFRLPSTHSSVLVPDDIITTAFDSVFPFVAHINNYGDIVGYLEFPSPMGYRSFLIGSGVHNITSVDLYESSQGNNIAYWRNDSGITCGATFFSAFHSQAIYNPFGGAFSNLHVTGKNLATSVMNAVNNNNTAIGYYVDDNSTMAHPYKITIGLDVLPSRDLLPVVLGGGSIPTAINNNNVVVGAEVSEQDLPFTTYVEPYRFDANGYVFLRPLLDDSGAGIVIQEPKAINDSGQIITYSRNPSNGRYKAYLLTPTQPFQVVDTLPQALPISTTSRQLQIRGFGFVPGSQVYFKGLQVDTTYVSDELLNATIPAKYLKNTGSVSVRVKNPSGRISNDVMIRIVSGQFKSLVVTPFTVGGGSAGSGTLTLNFPAPAGGLSVSLSSNMSCVIPPASVSVLEGQTSVTFGLPTLAVAADTSVVITAAANGETKTGNMKVKRSVVSLVAFDKGSVRHGETATGTVTLTGPAPTGGLTVTLSSSKTALNVPASVMVLAGNTSAVFTATGTAVVTKTSVTVSATGGAVTKTATIAVSP